MNTWSRSIALAAILSVGAVSGALAQGKAAAPSGQDLLKKYGCLACHAVDKKVIGPAHRDVAVKYRGVKGAEDQLVTRITVGGAGVWGKIPMPPHKHVPQADIRTMVQYILTYK